MLLPAYAQPCATAQQHGENQRTGLTHPPPPSLFEMNVLKCEMMCQNRGGDMTPLSSAKNFSVPKIIF